MREGICLARDMFARVLLKGALLDMGYNKGGPFFMGPLEEGPSKGCHLDQGCFKENCSECSV